MNYRKFGALHLGIGRRSFLRVASGATLGASISGGFLVGCERSSSNIAEPFDAATPWWLQGNFAPVYDEVAATDLEVHGAIPSALDGRYVRNGSNPASGESAHWFFGDGMLHSVELSGGRATAYRNRWVETGRLTGGTVPGSVPGGGNNASNVSAFHHAGKLLTSGEVGLPFKIDANDLSTIGVYDFGGKLTQSFTAHPKIDPATAYLHSSCSTARI
jgi:carotenoid cleavage dioxygenase